jgi:hypothetical protein
MHRIAIWLQHPLGAEEIDDEAGDPLVQCRGDDFADRCLGTGSTRASHGSGAEVPQSGDLT